MRMFCWMGSWSHACNQVAQTRHLPSGCPDPQGICGYQESSKQEGAKKQLIGKGGETPALLGLRWWIGITDRYFQPLESWSPDFLLELVHPPKELNQACCLHMASCNKGLLDRWVAREGRDARMFLVWSAWILMEQNLDLNLEPLPMATAPCSYPASPKGDPREEEDVPAAYAWPMLARKGTAEGLSLLQLGCVTWPPAHRACLCRGRACWWGCMLSSASAKLIQQLISSQCNSLGLGSIRSPGLEQSIYTCSQAQSVRTSLLECTSALGHGGNGTCET